MKTAEVNPLYEDKVVEVLDRMHQAGLADDARYLANALLRILPFVSAFYFHLAKDPITGGQYRELEQRVVKWINSVRK